MFVFWVLQTACFALYSETGNIAAAHTFIAMICEWSQFIMRLETLEANYNDLMRSPVLCIL